MEQDPNRAVLNNLVNQLAQEAGDVNIDERGFFFATIIFYFLSHFFFCGRFGEGQGRNRLL